MAAKWITKISLQNLDEYLYENHEEISYKISNKTVFIEDLDTKIESCGYYLKIDGYRLYPGSMLCFSAAEGDWEADTDLVIITDENGSFLYYENDGFEVSLHNYLTSMDKRADFADDIGSIVADLYYE